MLFISSTDLLNTVNVNEADQSRFNYVFEDSMLFKYVRHLHMCVVPTGRSLFCPRMRQGQTFNRQTETIDETLSMFF